MQSELEVRNLGRLEAADLQKHLRSVGIECSVAGQESTSYGDPATVSLLLQIAPAAVAALAAWLMKPRVAKGETLSFAKREADGSWTVMKWKSEESSSSNASAKIVETLANVTKLDSSAIAESMK